jgi:hypothetical protein
MSKSKDLINLLANIKYKSVSKVDMQYNKIFKEYSLDSLIYHQIFANKVRKKWASDEDADSKSKARNTNDKLMQLINSNKNTSKLHETFFKSMEKDSLLNQIIKKENSSDKITSNKYSKNAISTKIKNIIENRKKFNVSNEFLKRRHEENNRKPPLCLYSPKYTYIYKHMPNFYFFREKHHPRIRNNDLNNDYNKMSNNTRESNISNIEGNTSTSNINNIDNMKKSVFQVKNKFLKSTSFLTPIHLSNNRSCISIFGSNDDKDKSKESEENKSYILNKKNENFFLSQHGAPTPGHEIENKINNISNVNLEYSPKIIDKKKLVPDFRKMMPRFTHKHKGVALRNLDYSPKYDAIFSNVLAFRPIDYEKRRKHYCLKKIITTYNPTSEYMLFPELNLKNNI